MPRGYVYIITNQPHGVLYTGVTNDIGVRMQEHRNGRGSEFASKYKLKRLVYVENHDVMHQAIHREKCIKEWKRDWKIELIESINPEWRDLFHEAVLDYT